MKKKLTNEEIAQFIGKIADQVRDEMDNDLARTYGHMCVAETDLADTFNKEQKERYEDFCQNREEFYSIAAELYERKY